VESTSVSHKTKTKMAKLTKIHLPLQDCPLWAKGVTLPLKIDLDLEGDWVPPPCRSPRQIIQHQPAPLLPAVQLPPTAVMASSEPEVAESQVESPVVARDTPSSDTTLFTQQVFETAEDQDAVPTGEGEFATNRYCVHY
jgi:hypothetical protein